MKIRRDTHDSGKINIKKYRAPAVKYFHPPKMTSKPTIQSIVITASKQQSSTMRHLSRYQEPIRQYAQTLCTATTLNNNTTVTTTIQIKNRSNSRNHHSDKQLNSQQTITTTTEITGESVGKGSTKISSSK